jgi:hypothetical protein
MGCVSPPSRNGFAGNSSSRARTENPGQLGLEHLERDVAIVLLVTREIDGGHAALAELALDQVATLEGGVQAHARVRHADNMRAGPGNREEGRPADGERPWASRHRGPK